MYPPKREDIPADVDTGDVLHELRSWRHEDRQWRNDIGPDLTFARKLRLMTADLWTLTKVLIVPALLVGLALWFQR